MSAIAALTSTRKADPFRRRGDARGCIAAHDGSGGGDGSLAGPRYLAKDLRDVAGRATGGDFALLELAAGLQGAGVWRDVEPTDLSAIIESRS